MFIRRSLLAFLILAAAPAGAQTGDSDWLYRGSDIARDPSWTFGTLPNGVRYAVRRNALPAGQVSMRVRIAAGALHEEDQERGWAHFVEHLAFRGTKSFGDREARHIWQKLGASFGSDTNASTTSTQTVYQLDLPNADQAKLDQSLHVLSEMVDTALFDPAAVDAERKIVLAEKGRRPELTNKMIEASWPLIYAGLRIADRDTIGTEPTLRAADVEGLRAFYERWYRPDRTTVVMVGDADPKMMEALIAKRFGDWKASGPAPREPDYGSIERLEQRAVTVAYPGAPAVASLAWLRPYVALPNTKARERDDLARSLAARILNRRLEDKARGEASYVSSGVGEQRSNNVADMTSLAITAREGRWREALAENFAIISDALRAPPSPEEIARELSNLRTAIESAVTGESTVRSQQRAGQLVNAVDDNTIVTTAPVQKALIEELAPQMTPAAVAAGMKQLFEGAGPRLVLLTPQPVEGGQASVISALQTAEKAAPAVRRADRKVSFDDLPKLGPAGKEVSRERIEDLGVTMVRFANGSTLAFKQTDYEKGQVSVQLRFGTGISGLSPAAPSLAWMGGVVGPSGVANLDLDALERLLTGRRMALSFGMSDDALVLQGATNGTDLSDQLRLLATKLAYPRWDAPLFARTKAGALEGYDLSFASASARAGREFAGFVRGGDARWAPVEKQRIATTSLPDVQAFFDPLLASGPIYVTIVGDVDLETAVAAVARSVGALPARAPASIAADARKVQPPRPNPRPVTFTHQGDKDQAFATIGWSTFGGMERTRDRRALALAANMLQVRLFDRLREEEGATYSPSAISSTSEELPDWGIFYAAAEIRPESSDTFFRIAREIVADLAVKPAMPDEFERAQNPVISGIERRLKTNSYWMSEISGWSKSPALVERTRSFISDYRSMTPEEVRAAVAQHVADAGDWSMLVLPGKATSGGK